MENKKTKLFIFYGPDREVYAFTENKKLAELFEGTRRLNGYIKKKVTMTEYQYRPFLAFYKNKILFLNVLTDGSHSFDYVTTYEENAKLDAKCDEIYNRILELERILLQVPFTEEMRECLGTLVAARKSEAGKYGKFNTFEIFVEMFKDSIL